MASYLLPDLSCRNGQQKIEKNPASRIRRKTEEWESQVPQRHRGERSANVGTVRLRWSQVDFERKQIHLPKTKNGDARLIRLNSLAAALRLYGNLSSIELGLWFPSVRTDDSLQGSWVWFPAAQEDAGIEDFTWHCLRHTFASRLVMDGVDFRTAGELLGHKSLSMTMRYAHLAPAQNAAAVNGLVSNLEMELAP